MGLQASGGSRSPASLGPHFCNLKGSPLVLTFSQHLSLLALGVGRFNLFPVSLLLVGGGGWGGSLPKLLLLIFSGSWKFLRTSRTFLDPSFFSFTLGEGGQQMGTFLPSYICMSS